MAEEKKRGCLQTTAGVVALIVLGIVVVGVIAAAVNEDEQEERVERMTEELLEETTTTEAPAEATTTAPAGVIRSGTSRVGADIQPGTYRTTEEGCYWARLSGFGGEIDDIIANGHTTGPSVVTIQPTDAGFETQCTWRKA